MEGGRDRGKRNSKLRPEFKGKMNSYQSSVANGTEAILTRAV